MIRIKANIGISVCILLFVCGALIIGETKASRDGEIPQNPETVVAWLTPHINSDRAAGRPNLRVFGSIIGLGLQAINDTLLGLQFLGHDDSPTQHMKADMLVSSSPYLDLASGLVTATVSFRIYVLLMLSPLMLFVVIAFRYTWQKIILLLALFSAIGGWPEALITTMFRFFSVFLDWPHAYFLFQQKYNSYDFSAVFISFILLIYLSYREKFHFLELLCLSVIAQLTFEYLGLVFACGGFMRMYFDTNAPYFSVNRILPAFILSVQILVFAAIVAGVVTAFFFLNGGEVIGTVPGLSATEANFQTLPHFIWLVTFMISMLIPSCITGMTIGIAFGMIDGERFSSLMFQKEFGATFGIFMGFILVMVAGLFTAYYPSELGRQMMPMSLITLVLTVKMGEYLGGWTRQRLLDSE